MTSDVNNFLEHHGVKGMRWGVTRDRGSSSGPSRKERRQQKNQEINDARIRQAGRAKKLEESAFKSYLAKDDKQAEKFVKQYLKQEEEYLTNPDAATAAKLTSGEKWALGIEWASVGIGAALLGGSAYLNKRGG